MYWITVHEIIVRESADLIQLKDGMPDIGKVNGEAAAQGMAE